VRRVPFFELLVVAGLLLGGCAAASHRPDRGEAARPSDLAAGGPPVEPVALREADSSEDTAPGAGELVAQARTAPLPPLADFEEEYDPWEPFNERMFQFNYQVDRYVLKPVARGYRTVIPERVQLMVDNGFHNIKFVPRFVNNLLQGKVEGALRELSRFVVNSTLGIGGLFDAGKHAGLERSNEDFGQTLGVWGTPAGPYLVLPLLEPMTVRDGIGRAVDGAMDPLTYVLPLFFDRLGMRIGETVNDRALNYDLFQGVEETTLDLYSSVRHFYLKRREQQIKE
jgi:phospholipid-binding lipoprotein MlaA